METLSLVKPNRKSEIFDSGRVDRYPVDPDFVWVTQEGEHIPPKEMNVHHLYHALRMIWNHSVPVEYRFLPFKPYHLRISRNRRRRCVANLYSELMNRTNRTPQMDATLETMAAWVIMSEQKSLPK